MKWMLCFLTALLFFQSAAGAHERRQVIEDYQWIVGFLNEPAFAGAVNGVDLRVTDAEGNPVEGLEETLRAEITVPEASGKLEVPLERRYGKPGSYGGYFIPSRPGAYRFRIHGTVRGEPVDEAFASGPETFGGVRAAPNFPEKTA